MYAAADSTPLFLMAVADYVRASGDVAFLTAHRDAIEKAWAFETDPAHDTDHDGIYDNSQGTGWVESWPTGMPHQEIYLALLDQQASAAMAQIETLLQGLIESRSRAGPRGDDCQDDQCRVSRPRERLLCLQPRYGEGWNHLAGPHHDRVSGAGVVVRFARTSSPSGNGSILAQPSGCLSQFANATLNTDWGLRDIANNEKFYDGMSYHQGSVWPLFTGWAAHGGISRRAAAGRLPDADGERQPHSRPGSRRRHRTAVRGFFVPFGRSTSHQLWSSAMVITPILRGMFGISVDAQTKTITVNPQLPAGWDHAAVMNVSVPGGPTSLTFDRKGATLEVSLGSDAGRGVASAQRPAAEQASDLSAICGR